MKKPVILSIDQGTGSTKALLINAAGEVISKAQIALSLTTPQAGWVEQDANEIWQSVLKSASQLVYDDAHHHIVAIGFSTQRESCLAWERKTGKLLSPVLSWQDQRTLELCNRVSDKDKALIREITGLPLDPMFSALKIQWILNQIDPDRLRAKAGEICIGTIDSFLIYKMSGEHIVEAGNASRMQLVDISSCNYDTGLLDLFDIPLSILPKIVPSSKIFAKTRNFSNLSDGIPVTAVLADSHAALFAHGAFRPGLIKATQGTGSSIMGLFDTHKSADINPGVCQTIAWHIDKPYLAFEGNIRSIGSTLNWLSNILGVRPHEVLAMAETTGNDNSVVFIPAFGGLGAPWWDIKANCVIGGLSFHSKRENLARAAVDSIAHQIADVIDCVKKSNILVEKLFVDGGLTANTFLMQMEANFTNVPVICSEVNELSAMGAGHLAGVGIGMWSMSELEAMNRDSRCFLPQDNKMEHIQQSRLAWQNLLMQASQKASDILKA